MELCTRSESLVVLIIQIPTHARKGEVGFALIGALIPCTILTMVVQVTNLFHCTLMAVAFTCEAHKCPASNSSYALNLQNCIITCRVCNPSIRLALII